ncbi:MAG: sugar-binding protein [Cellvibrio sp.]|uniref:sugar-binding protein n=1 Tax=Cellvibrio sp. TaxID=1965322 RepID=UPI0031AD89BF
MNFFRYPLRQTATLMGLGILALQSAQSYAAKCEYVVQSDWNNGFVASVRITNNTSTAINGWSVNWAYTDGTSRTSGWNANVTGNNPYTATSLNWNNTINPGQSIEFGVQGIKGSGSNPAPKPIISGNVCSASVSSVAVSAISSVSNSVLPNYSSHSSSSQASSIYTSAYSSSRSNSSSSYQSTSFPFTSSSRISSSASSGYPSTSAPFISSRSSASSSYISSSSYTSSSKSSSSAAVLPIADFNVTVNGLTVFVDSRISSDPLNRPLRQHYINFGDSSALAHTHGWHTYQEPGEYEITLSLYAAGSGTQVTAKKWVQTYAPTDSNRAPINMLAAARTGLSFSAWGSASFDEDGDSLQYIWDFGQGEFIGNSKELHYECMGGSSSSYASTSSVSSLSKVILTVSDGTLADTKTVTRSANCRYNEELYPTPKIKVRADGLTIYADARESSSVTGIVWDFGDGSISNNLIASHTYATAGEYQLKLTGLGEYFNNSVILPITIGNVASSSSLRSSTPSSQSSSSSSAVSSVPASSSSAQSSTPNHYNAPRAAVAPIIDGIEEAVWSNATWSPINVFWLGTQPNPNFLDYGGRYKAVWTPEYLYLLFEITDDQLFDGVSNPLDRYWEDDTVELFIDENHNGGEHAYNTSAWAYHVSTLGDVVDYTTSGPKLLNDHIQVARSLSPGNLHRWEMRVKIFGEDYADWKTNIPLTLYAGKLMGFSAAYIDNDGSPQRESMMGSVDTQGHKNNQGYLDASVFGTLQLVE